jgi:hypothetical protein
VKGEQMTLIELEQMVERAFELKKEVTEQKRIAADLSNELDLLQMKIIEELESADLLAFKSKSGTFSYRYSESFKVPRTPEDKQKFFAYLTEKGVYDELITVNSQTLNSWVKQELEENLDLQIPGLVKSEPYPVASMRRS